jgi:hypothetical protein
MTIISAILIVSCPMLVAATPSDSTEIQREIVRRANERFGFERHSGRGVAVDRNGRITGINGIYVNVDSTFRLADWAYDFLERNADLFGMASPRQEFGLSFVYDNVVRMHQVVNGIEVMGALVQIVLSADRTYTGVDIYYSPAASNVNTTPAIDSLEAGRIAQADPIHGDARTYACCYELWVSSTYDGVHSFPDGEMRLVWRLGVGGGYENSAFYWMDAHSGRILDARCALR